MPRPSFAQPETDTARRAPAVGVRRLSMRPRSRVSFHPIVSGSSRASPLAMPLPRESGTPTDHAAGCSFSREAQAGKAEADADRGELVNLTTAQFGEFGDYARDWTPRYQGRTSRGLCESTRRLLPADCSRTGSSPRRTGLDPGWAGVVRGPDGALVEVDAFSREVDAARYR